MFMCYLRLEHNQLWWQHMLEVQAMHNHVECSKFASDTQSCIIFEVRGEQWSFLVKTSTGNFLLSIWYINLILLPDLLLKLQYVALFLERGSDLSRTGTSFSICMYYPTVF